MQETFWEAHFSRYEVYWVILKFDQRVFIFLTSTKYMISVYI